MTRLREWRGWLGDLVAGQRFFQTLGLAYADSEYENHRFRTALELIQADTTDGWIIEIADAAIQRRKPDESKGMHSETSPKDMPEPEAGQ